MIVVIKIGTSSLTTRQTGTVSINHAVVAALASQVAAAVSDGHQVLVVTSAAITAGEAVLGISRENASSATLQALSTVGQSRLMGVYEMAFAGHDLHVGQVLMAPTDFFERSRYLLARNVLQRLLELGTVPIINENDAVTTDAIGFGDNDRIAALVAQLLQADLLLLLTDTAGVFTADPRTSQDASLIAEISEIDAELEAAAGQAGSFESRGGMASKLSAAKMAAHSGVAVVVADSQRDNVVADAIAGREVGTRFAPRDTKLPARKLWIGFALPAKGVVTVDAGAAKALLERGGSLLTVGVVAVTGEFEEGEAVEVRTEQGELIAKGLVALASQQAAATAGQRHERELIHRDQLILLA